jgi:catalase
MTDQAAQDGEVRDGFNKDRQLYELHIRLDGEYLTSKQGVRISHTDDSLKARERGPGLMQDFHSREKITQPG